MNKYLTNIHSAFTIFLKMHISKNYISFLVAIIRIHGKLQVTVTLKNMIHILKNASKCIKPNQCSKMEKTTVHSLITLNFSKQIKTKN